MRVAWRGYCAADAALHKGKKGVRLDVRALIKTDTKKEGQTGIFGEVRYRAQAP